MTKRFLHQLVLTSYINNHLNAKKVDAIAASLTRHDLKAYIRALKLLEQQNRISVALPKANLYNEVRKNLEKLFPNKQLVLEENPSLLLGMQLIDNDMVYEMSLRDRLEEIVDQINEQN